MRKMSSVFLFFQFSFVSILLGVTACTKKNSSYQGPSNPTPSWAFFGSEGGFISSIAFHPSTSCEVWASGDDMSGIYKSTDCGANWSLESTPVNVSTYSLTFDPTDTNKLYAVSHFGWGLLKSTDRGASWNLAQAGLPSAGTSKRVYQTAIDPISPSTILVATDDGVYRSTNSGASFSKLSIAWGTAFKAVAYSNDGRLFAGASNGVIQYSDDDGSTWSNLLTGSIGVSKIVTSSNAVYFLFEDATLMFVSLPSFATGGTLNDSSTGIATGLKSEIAVHSGASQSTDLIYLGTSRNSAIATSRWGLFKSSNGGTSWTQMTSAVAGKSIFSIAIDPTNTNRVLVGTANSAGIFRTTNSGLTWTESNNGILANSALGFAQNPLNTNELIVSSTVGGGLGQSYRSTNGGNTWSVISEVNSEDGVVAWSFDPATANVVLAGLVSKGLYRSTTGVTGSWTRIITTETKIDRIYRDSVNTSVIYALARDGTPSTDVRLYYSSDSGASFTKRSSTFATDLSPHPLITNEAVVTSTSDGFVSTNGFLSQVSLNLSSQATAQNGLTAIAFDPTNTSRVWVGGAAGGLFKTENYVNTGVGVTWTTLTSPISNARVQNILVKNESGVPVIYVSSFAGDVYFSSGATLGLWKSTDLGSTWTQVSSSISPCTSFWGIQSVLGSSTDVWAMMWGGGLFKYQFQ